MRADLIHAVEACYAMHEPEEAWLASVVQAFLPWLDRGRGAGAWPFSPGTWTQGSRPIGLDNELGEKMFQTPPHFRTDELTRAFLSKRVGTLGERLGYDAAQLSQHPAFQLHEPLGVGDFLGLTVFDASGSGVLVVAPQPDRSPTPRRLRTRLEYLGSHLHAAFRLRRSFAQEDAVLSPDGHTLHAEGPAKGKSARERLREAVVAIDRARAQPAEDSEDALEGWQALVAGRWSIVERFESDGRRFLIARPNPPGAAPEPMSPLQQHALLLRAQGLSLKVICYELGLSEATASRFINGGLRQLGLRSEVELLPLFLGQVEGLAKRAGLGQ